MKKTLIITLHTGRVIKRDITLEKFDGIPIGAPANHPGYLQLCLFYASTGTTDIEATDENKMTLITPSSIATVCIEFEKKPA